MPAFTSYSGKMSQESSYITKDGFYHVEITDAKRDDVSYPGGKIDKYSIEMLVRSDIEQPEQGKMIKGDIMKPREQYATPDDNAWGGWNARQISKYAIGAGLDKSGKDIANMRQLCVALIGKNIYIEVQQRPAKDGKMYARVVDVVAMDDVPSTPLPGFAAVAEEMDDDDSLPF